MGTSYMYFDFQRLVCDVEEKKGIEQNQLSEKGANSVNAFKAFSVLILKVSHAKLDLRVYLPQELKSNPKAYWQTYASMPYLGLDP